MTDPPQKLADRPGPEGLNALSQPYDLLSELLRSVRLTGERIAAYAPASAAAVSFAGTGTVHLVDGGELALHVDGERHVERLGGGDIVLLPRGDAHRISDVGPRSADDPARWLCGTFTIGDPTASHLLASLPPVIVLRGGGGPALEGLQVARRMLLVEMESPTQGSAVMIARILDVVLIQILRLWAAGPDAGKNWLAGALDPQIGPALSAIHRGPDHDWTVEELARECSLSRSAFAERFSARVGKPPATYLAHVRLDSATDLLRETTLPMTVIARKVGYTSEAAFSRAFRNRYGTPPARWRRSVSAPKV